MNFGEIVNLLLYAFSGICFVAWIMATLLLGSKAVAWFFIPPFLVSTIGGSVIACLLLKTGFFKQFSSKEGK